MRVFLFITMALLITGCASDRQHSEFETSSAKQQNNWLKKHLKTVWLIEVYEVDEAGRNKIADIDNTGLIEEFRTCTRVSEPAALSFGSGDLVFVCMRTDGTMLELWYGPEKLTGATGSNLYGVPAPELQAFVQRICETARTETVELSNGSTALL